MADENAPASTQTQSQSMFGDKAEAATKANTETVRSGGVPAQPATPAPTPDVVTPPAAQAPDPNAAPKPADNAPAATPPKEGEAAENKAPEEPAKPKPPEKYELKLSDNSLFDKSHIDKIAAIAKAQGLSQDEASGLLKAQEQEVANFVETRKQTWLEATKADREIGGQALNENVQLADKVLKQYGTPELRAELDKTGYGNHPEMIRLLSKLGRASSNDRAHVPSVHQSAPKSAADLLYDNAKSK